MIQYTAKSMQDVYVKFQINVVFDQFVRECHRELRTTKYREPSCLKIRYTNSGCASSSYIQQDRCEI